MTPEQIKDARALVNEYDRQNPMRAADVHDSLCTCTRCLRDALTAALDEIERIEKRDSFDDLIADAKSEAITAMRKFPQPNYVISKVAEEAGEVVKTAIHCAEGRDTPEELRGEIKQLIAMLYRLWVEGDEVHGLPAVRAALAGSDQ